MTENKKIVTYKYKMAISNYQAQELERQARIVAAVWNYCSDVFEWVNKEHFKRHPDHKKTKEDGYFYTLDVPTYAAGTNFPIDKTRKIIITSKNFPPIIKPKKGEDFESYSNPDWPEDVKPLASLSTSKTIGGYTLICLTGGISKFLNINSATIQSVCETFDASVKTKFTQLKNKAVRGRPKKRFIGRKDKYARPWVPVKSSFSIENIKNNTADIVFKKNKYKFFIGGLDLDGTAKTASFVKDPDGWYLCLVMEVEKYGLPPSHNNPESGLIGVDMGLKTAIACSDGSKLEMPENFMIKLWGKTLTTEQHKSRIQSKMKKLENNGKKESKTYQRLYGLKRKIEQKEKQMRHQAHFNIAHELLDKAETVKIGNLNMKFMQQAYGKKIGKWGLGQLKERIEWISKKRGQKVIFVNEKYSTMTCNVCKKQTGPHGREGLSVREWVCSECSTKHDRDTNAAINISLVAE